MYLRDQWNVLRRHSLRLKYSGVVVACIPSVQHWSVLATLMRGDWPVMDDGLFDRTNMRSGSRKREFVSYFLSRVLRLLLCMPESWRPKNVLNSPTQ